MTDDSETAESDAAPSFDVERAGPTPPSEEGLAEVSADLLDAVDVVDAVYLVRVAFADGSRLAVAERLLDAIEERITVVGSTLPSGFDPANPELDVLVETDHDRDAIASALADLDPVEGVVVAGVGATDAALGGDRDGVTSATPGADDAESAPAGADQLSIYRMDDHLLVTEDLGALVERFDEELEPSEEAVEARELARTAGEDVEELRTGLREVGRDVHALHGDVEAVQRELETTREALEGTADAAKLARLAERVEEEVPTHEELERVEEEVPTHEELERVFAPAGYRVDDPDEHHSTIRDAVEEIDRELRRTHALREAGLLGRLRWVLTGDVPAGED